MPGPNNIISYYNLRKITYDILPADSIVVVYVAAGEESPGVSRVWLVVLVARAVALALTYLAVMHAVVEVFGGEEGIGPVLSYQHEPKQREEARLS